MAVNKPRLNKIKALVLELLREFEALQEEQEYAKLDIAKYEETASIVTEMAVLRLSWLNSRLIELVKMVPGVRVRKRVKFDDKKHNSPVGDTGRTKSKGKPRNRKG